MVLDNPSYFTAIAVQEYVEETTIELCYPPRSTPDLNATEECWQQLSRVLGNRLFDSLDELHESTLSVLDAQIDPSGNFIFLLP